MPYRIHPDYPDVLVIVDSGICNEQTGEVDGGELTRYISRRPTGCPLTIGSHDFWLMHPKPRSAGGGYWGPTSWTPTPRPFRGFVRLTLPDVIDATSSSEYLSTVLQEVGHHWLVPDQLRFNGLEVTDTIDFYRAMMLSAPLPGLALRARTGAHWSVYMAAGSSPIDGIDWQQREAYQPDWDQPARDDRIMRRYAIRASAETSPVDGIGEVSIPRFSDMDLTIMGAISPSDAYPNEQNSLDDLNPHWMAPLDFHAGLAVAFAPRDFLYFGFHASHRTLAVQRSGGPLQAMDISTNYLPWALASRMYLRVVRRGTTYHLQARIHTRQLQPQDVGRETPALDPFDEIDVLPAPTGTPPDWETWQTMFVIDGLPEPRGVGYIAKTWGNTPPMIDINFEHLHIQAEKGGRHSLTNLGTPTTDPGYLDLLTTDSLTFHRPKWGPRWNRQTSDGALGSLVVAASVLEEDNATPREVGAHDHWSNADDAPKLITAAPEGDFAVAGSVAIRRALMAPHAGGAVNGRELWAQRRRWPMSILELPADDEPARRYDGSPYRAAFILAVARESEATDERIAALDVLRRASEEAFTRATQRRRNLDTRLSAP